MTDDELRKLGADFIRRKQQDGTLDGYGNFLTPDSSEEAEPENKVTHGAFMSGFRNNYAERNFKDSANTQMQALAAHNGYMGTPYENMDKEARQDVYKKLWQESQDKAKNAQSWKQGNMDKPVDGWWDRAMYGLGDIVADWWPVAAGLGAGVFSGGVLGAALPTFLGGAGTGALTGAALGSAYGGTQVQTNMNQGAINDKFRYLISLGYPPEEAMIKAQNERINIPDDWNNRRGTVSRVIDGDTFVANTGNARYPVQQTIRVGGVNTPEVPHPEVGKPYGEYFGQEATDFTANQVLGKDVILEYPYMPVDAYGRTVANVWTTSGDERGDLLSELLVGGGYGDPLNIEPNSQYKDRLEQARKEAKRRKAGLYGPNKY